MQMTSAYYIHTYIIRIYKLMDCHAAVIRASCTYIHMYICTKQQGCHAAVGNVFGGMGKHGHGEKIQ